MHSINPRQERISHITAFTLVELLTVIVIIGILAAIIIPVTARVRQSARAAQCLSNIRQWAIATQLYVNDNKGSLPETAWNTTGNYAQYHLLGYLTSNAPTDPTKRWELIKKNYDCPDDGWMYGFNVFISDLPLATLTQPSRQILATCSASGWLDNEAITGGNAYLKKIPKPHSGEITLVRVSGASLRKKVSKLIYAEASRDTSYYKAAHETTYFLNGDPQYDR